MGVMAKLLNLTTANIEQAFNNYDTDHSQALEADEIQKLANSLSLTITTDEILKTIKSKYGEEADSISKAQFVKLVETAFQQHNEVVLSFKYFDKNNDGEISFIELKEGIKKLYKEKKIEKISKTDLKKMFKDADKDGDKKISFEEFAEMLDNEVQI